MYRLLIVEDDIIICGGIKVFLEGKGYKVDTAHTVSEAEQVPCQEIFYRRYRL